MALQDSQTDHLAEVLMRLQSEDREGGVSWRLPKYPDVVFNAWF